MSRHRVDLPPPCPIAVSLLRGSGDQTMFRPFLNGISRNGFSPSFQIANRLIHKRGSVRPLSGSIKKRSRSKSSGDIGYVHPGAIL